MAATRKPSAYEKQQAADRERVRAEEAFRKRLGALVTVADADRLAIEPRGPRAVDRHLYSNFSFFWSQGFAIPAGATAWELRLYLDVLRRLDAGGALNPGALGDHQRRLERAAAGRA